MLIPRKVDMGLCGTTLGLLWSDAADSELRSRSVFVAFDLGEQVASDGVPGPGLPLMDKFRSHAVEDAFYRRAPSSANP